VAWEDDPEIDGTSRVLAAAFTASGAKDVQDFAVSGSAPGADYRKPAVAINKSLDFVVAWQDDGDGDGQFKVGAQQFYLVVLRVTQLRLQNDLQLGWPDSGAGESPPAVAMSYIELVVVWEDQSTEIRAASFYVDGYPRAAPFRVNRDSSGDQRAPSVVVGLGVGPIWHALRCRLGGRHERAMSRPRTWRWRS
jgi:hypothetical protein